MPSPDQTASSLASRSTRRSQLVVSALLELELSSPSNGSNWTFSFLLRLVTCNSREVGVGETCGLDQHSPRRGTKPAARDRRLP